MTAIFKPYDRSAALLFYGAMGLVFMLLAETFGAMIVLDQGFADALYGSTKSLATVGPNDAVSKGPSWFKLAIVASMLLTLLSAACFTGGLIDRLTSTRLTGLVGPQRRAAARPRRRRRARPGRLPAVHRAARVRHPGRRRRGRRGRTSPSATPAGTSSPS